MSCGITINPMDIHHIVENVLQYASGDLHNLCQARLVNTQWNTIASKKLKSQVIISFGEFGINLGRLKQFTNENLYSTLINFKLYPEIFQQKNELALNSFFTSYSPWIERLEIFLDGNSDFEPNCKFHFINLKYLIFDDRRRRVTNEKHNFLESLLASSVSTLEDLQLHFPRELSEDIMQPPALSTEREKSIAELLSNVQLAKLKKITLDLTLTNELCEKLTQLHWSKLESLHLSLGSCTVKTNTLYALLDKFKTSLTQLKLTDIDRNVDITIQFPMDYSKLTHFEISGFEVPARGISFDPFSYEKYFPNLNTLVLNSWENRRDWIQFISQKNLNIKNLSLPMNFDDVDHMRYVTNSFPNVTRLEMFFLPQTIPLLQIVFQEMPNIEELTVKQSYLGDISRVCIDHVITGLNGSSRLQNKSSDPSLLNLTCLKKLDLSGLRHRNIITDVSARVFLKMSSLQSLNVECSNFSDVCSSRLSTRFPHQIPAIVAYERRYNNDSKRFTKDNHSSFSLCSIV